jgi:predicted kinase
MENVSTSSALAAAKGHFDLAYRYPREKPFMLIIGGLVGTGKITVTQALSQSLGFTAISPDITRKRLAGIVPTEHRFEEFRGGIYSADFSQKTYDEMLAQAKKVLSQRNSVIIDASFKKKEERVRVKSLAEEMNANFMVIECILDEKTIKSRLEQRLKKAPSPMGAGKYTCHRSKILIKLWNFSQKII